MKINRIHRLKLRAKFALLLAALGMVLTAIGLPCVAQTPATPLTTPLLRPNGTQTEQPENNPESKAVVNEVRNKLLGELNDSTATAQQAAADTPDVTVYPTDPLLIKASDVPSLVTDQEDLTPEAIESLDNPMPPQAFDPETGRIAPRDTLCIISGHPQSIYGRPASWTYSEPWWHGLWINTAVYAGAFVSTLLVLETLPEDATAWNRKEISSVPFYKRWFRNIFKKGPEWDHDLFIFNFVLHPYAGAVYFMAARTCGFNFWQSMLYSAAISTLGWEFGIEACMERPSYQDIFITPLVGSMIGEGFYRLKRMIVDRNYEILGSNIFGHFLAFFLDPVNEVVGWLSPRYRCRTIGPQCLQSQPLLIPSPGFGGTPAFGISVSASF